MIRRIVSAQGLRPDVDPLEERKLLSTFDDFNSIRFNGPLPFQQAMPVVLRVDYAPAFAGGDPGAILPWDFSSPVLENIGGVPFNPGNGSAPFDPAQGMTPPEPYPIPSLIPDKQALSDGVFGLAPSHDPSESPSAGFPPGMIHSESLPPPDFNPPDLAYSANLAAHDGSPGEPSSESTSLLYEAWELLNVGTPPGARPGMIHSESLPPPDFNPPDLAASTRLAAHDGPPGEPSAESIALSHEVWELLNAGYSPGTIHAFSAVVGARIDSPSGSSSSQPPSTSGGHGIGALGKPSLSDPNVGPAVLELDAAVADTNAAVYMMARSGDPGVSQAISGLAASSNTPLMPNATLRLSPPFNDYAKSSSSATPGDLSSADLPQRNTSLNLESESLTDRGTNAETTGSPSEFEATAGVTAARGTELLSQFLPGDVALLGNAVDKFLERLQGLGDGLRMPDDSASARIEWPIAVTLGAVVLEIGRRRFLKREDDESAGSGFAPGSRLAGWPGSWTARVP